MLNRTKLWKLYIFPFLVIILMLGFEYIQTELQQHLSFEQISQETSALSEVDVRNLVETTVVEVIDGDTIEIETGEKVRYIGVDTPETVHPNKPVQCFGREASRKNTELVEGKKILMEKDVSETDRYGRLLRYVYIPNPEASNEALFVNEYLIEQGYGQVISYPPDVKYHQLLLDAQRLAQKEENGLWGKCTN